MDDYLDMGDLPGVGDPPAPGYTNIAVINRFNNTIIWTAVFRDEVYQRWGKRVRNWITGKGETGKWVRTDYRDIEERLWRHYGAVATAVYRNGVEMIRWHEGFEDIRDV